jgi:hypothetical protein
LLSGYSSSNQIKQSITKRENLAYHVQHNKWFYDKYVHIEALRHKPTFMEKKKTEQTDRKTEKRKI